MYLFYFGSFLSHDTNLRIQILSALCLSIQFTLTSEIHRFTSTRPRFPDPIPTKEKLTHLTLTRQFLSAAPTNPQITDATAATTQLLISTLGAIHALANPLGAWQSIKGAFSWLGNRKGQLTSQLNGQLLAALAGASAADAIPTLKKEMLTRSKQVKTGIRANRGPKRFFDYGKTELAALVGAEGASQMPGMVDLSEVEPNSKGMGVADLQAYAQDGEMRGQKMRYLEGAAKEKLEVMVNPVD